MFVEQPLAWPGSANTSRDFFLKFLPLDYNNHDNLYSIMKNNNNVASTAKEMITDTINNLPTEATKTKDDVWWPEWLPDIIFDCLRLLLVVFTIWILVYFVCTPPARKLQEIQENYLSMEARIKELIKVDISSRRHIWCSIRGALGMQYLHKEQNWCVYFFHIQNTINNLLAVVDPYWYIAYLESS